MSLREITEYELRAMGVASLPTRPTSPREFGGRGYTPAELKEAFDRLPRLVAERYNELLAEVTSGEYLSSIPCGDTSLRAYLDTVGEQIEALEHAEGALTTSAAAQEATLAKHTATISEQGSALVTLEDEVNTLTEEARFTRALLFGSTLAHINTADTFDMRETADGMHIVDDIQTVVHTVTGATVRNVNLISFSPGIVEKDGLKVTFFENGTFSVQGTSTAQVNIGIGGYFPVTAGKTYRLSGRPKAPTGNYTLIARMFHDGGNTLHYDEGNGVVIQNTGYEGSLTFQCAAGISFDKDIFRPMLAEGAEARPFVPHFTGLKNANFSRVKSTGRNLYKRNHYNSMSDICTVNGITFVADNERGGIFHASGTCTGTIYYRPIDHPSQVGIRNFGGTFSFTVFGRTISGKTSHFTVDRTYYYDNNGQRTFTVDMAPHIFRWDVVYDIGDVADETVCPMFCIGDTVPAVWEAYKDDTSFALPSPVALGAWDYIDIPAQKLVRATEILTFDGSEAWTGGNGIYSLMTSHSYDTAGATPICDRYTTILTEAFPMTDRSVYVSGTELAFHDAQHEDLAAWQAYLAAESAAGTPVTLAVKRTYPTEEPVSIPAGYTVWRGGSETIEQGDADNSVYNALCTVTQDYYVMTGEEVTA